MWWVNHGFLLRTSTFIWLRKKGPLPPKSQRAFFPWEGCKGWGGVREVIVEITSQNQRKECAAVLFKAAHCEPRTAGVEAEGVPGKQTCSSCQPLRSGDTVLGGLELSGTPEIKKWGIRGGEPARSGFLKETDRVHASPGSLLTGSGLQAPCTSRQRRRALRSGLRGPWMEQQARLWARLHLWHLSVYTSDSQSRGHSVPQGISGNVWRHFLVVRLGEGDGVCYWNLMGRGQGCCHVFLNEQDAPPQKKVCSPKCQWY